MRHIFVTNISHTYALMGDFGLPWYVFVVLWNFFGEFSSGSRAFLATFFQRYTCTIAAFSLNGEYVVRFFLPNGVFYFVTMGWFFYSSILCDNSINQTIN